MALQRRNNRDAMATRPKVNVFFDIISPFAYLAFYVTKNSPVFKTADVNYTPISLGGLMKACDNRPPLEIKNKDKWIDVERVRWAKRFDIPISPTVPDPFPQSTIKTQRALCALELKYPERLPDAVAAMYQAFWVETQPIDKVFADILAKALGEDVAEEIAQDAVGPVAKKKLHENTDWAFTEGAFGLPYFMCINSKGQKANFWGFDHLGQVLEHLELERGEDKAFRAML